MKITNYATYEYNPFRVEPGYFPKFGEVSHSTGEMKMKRRDMEDHIRIYPNAYDDFRDLNSMAVKIISYIFKELNNDVVRLNVSELMVEFGVSGRPTIYRGIEDLLEKKFIGRKAGTDMYFINPGKMYGKSRAKWYEETMIFDAKFNGMMQTISTYQTIKDKVLNK
jgi:hypothetical protein